MKNNFEVIRKEKKDQALEADAERVKQAEFDKQPENKDLGFGSKVSSAQQSRMLNRDGSFNVKRVGFAPFHSLHLYQVLITTSWGNFFLSVMAFYLSVNFFFAALYFISGADALNGLVFKNEWERFIEDFFFSVQTFTTIGYGRVNPAYFITNVLSAIEAFIGLMGFALATSLLFARFSRPHAKILFSNRAIIAPYKNINAFEFRIANARSNQLIEVEINVSVALLKNESGKVVRRFHELALERKKVVFFPLNWTIVHPIDESSPLLGYSYDDLVKADAEFLILLTALDDTFGQSVHTRSSYKFDEVIVGAKYKDMFTLDTNGSVQVDLRKIHDYNLVELNQS